MEIKNLGINTKNDTNKFEIDTVQCKFNINEKELVSALIYAKSFGAGKFKTVTLKVTSTHDFDYLHIDKDFNGAFSNDISDYDSI